MNTDELRQLAEQATPGPWHSVKFYGIHRVNNPDPVNLPPIAACYSQNREADERYIAAASPDATLRLLDERDDLLRQYVNPLDWYDRITAAERRVATLEAALRELVDWFDGRSPGFQLRAKGTLFDNARQLLSEEVSHE